MNLLFNFISLNFIFGTNAITEELWLSSKRQHWSKIIMHWWKRHENKSFERQRTDGSEHIVTWRSSYWYRYKEQVETEKARNNGMAGRNMEINWSRVAPSTNITRIESTMRMLTKKQLIKCSDEEHAHHSKVYAEPGLVGEAVDVLCFMSSDLFRSSDGEAAIHPPPRTRLVQPAEGDGLLK